MLYAVVKREEGQDVGINRDGSRSTRPDDFELMPEDTAQVVAELHGGVLVSDARLFPVDYEIE